jgi:hypothetical protein
MNKTTKIILVIVCVVLMASGFIDVMESVSDDTEQTISNA